MSTVNAQSLGQITRRIAENCDAALKLESGNEASRGRIQDEITKDLKALVNLVGIDNLTTLAKDE